MLISETWLTVPTAHVKYDVLQLKVKDGYSTYRYSCLSKP